LYILGLAITGILTGGDGGLVVVMEDMDMVVVIGVVAVIEVEAVIDAVVAVIEVAAVIEVEEVAVIEVEEVAVEVEEVAVTEDNNLLSPLMPLYVILIP
jgi:hypothetical protein